MKYLGLIAIAILSGANAYMLSAEYGWWAMLIAFPVAAILGCGWAGIAVYCEDKA